MADMSLGGASSYAAVLLYIYYATCSSLCSRHILLLCWMTWLYPDSSTNTTLDSDIVLIPRTGFIDHLVPLPKRSKQSCAIGR